MFSNSNLSMSLFELFSTYEKYVISFRDFVQLTIQNNNKYPDSAKNAILFLTDFVAENFRQFENNSFHPVISTLVFSETYEVMAFLEQITGHMRSTTNNSLFDKDFYNFIHTFKQSVDLSEVAGYIKLFYYDQEQKDMIYFSSTHTSGDVDELEKKSNRQVVFRQFFSHLKKLINTFEKYVNNFSFTFTYENKLDNNARKIINGSIKNYINSTIDHIVFENIDESLSESFLIGLAYNLNSFYYITVKKVNENYFNQHIVNVQDVLLESKSVSQNDYSFLICNLYVIMLYNSILLFAKNYNQEFYDKISKILYNNN